MIDRSRGTARFTCDGATGSASLTRASVFSGEAALNGGQPVTNW